MIPLQKGHIFYFYNFGVSKQLTIEVRAQIEILLKESYSQSQIAKELKLVINGGQYSLQRLLETGLNVDGKRTGHQNWRLLLKINTLLLRDRHKIKLLPR